MKRLLAVVVLMLVISCLTFGQQQTTPPPKPGPEIQRLGSMLGTWKTDDGETVTYEWFDGGFSLIGHVQNSDKSTELRIITYDPDAKDYTHYRVTSMAPGGTLGRMTVTGNTWLSQWDGMEDGKPAKYRFTIVEVTPTSATAKLEVSVVGGPWTVTFETKSVKINNSFLSDDENSVHAIRSQKEFIVRKPRRRNTRTARRGDEADAFGWRGH